VEDFSMARKYMYLLERIRDGADWKKVKEFGRILHVLDGEL
jgi:hypothetical protein